MKSPLVTHLVLLALLAAGCSEAPVGVSSGVSDPVLLQAAPRVAHATSAAEAAFPHRLFLLRDGVIEASVSASSAAALNPFRVGPGHYGMLAVAASDERNLTFPPTPEGLSLSEYAVRITDIAAPIPDLLIGCNADFAAEGASCAVPVEMQRAVAHLSVTVVGLEALSAAEISVTLDGMYDRIGWDGTPSNSGTDFSRKRIVLTRNTAGHYVGEAMVLPTDAAASRIVFRFVIEGREYVSMQETRIEANRKYLLTVSARFNDQTDVKLAPVIRYVPWDAETVIEDPSLPQLDDRLANRNFQVEIYRNGTWEELFVHNARVSDYAPNPAAGYTQYDMGFVMFTDPFDAPLKIRVTRPGAPFSEVAIRPLSYGITPTLQTSNSVEFELPDASKKVSVEFDDNRMENLFLFPDRPDSSVPTGPDVIYFGPGIHNLGRKEILYKNNQTIYLDEGALVYGSIYAKGCRNLTIRGRGILCASKENHGEGRQPQIETFDCDGFSVEGILLRDTPNWTMKIVGSTGVHIDNIKQIGWIENSDGMDFICCRDVLVENTFQRNYDDNVAIKAFNGKNDYVTEHTAMDGSFTDASIWTVYYLPQEKFDVYDYEIRNCVFWADKAHNMVVGPESRGIPFRNIRFHDNIVLENRQDDEVYPGAMAVMIADNGTFEKIAFENIRIEDIRGGKPLCIQFANAWAFDGLYGQWARDITLRNITCTGSQSTRSRIRGRSDTQIVDGVTIAGFTVNGNRVTDGTGSNLEIGSHVRNVTFE